MNECLACLHRCIVCSSIAYVCVCVIVVMANTCMCVYMSVCACMNTMLCLCCYRMELWPLSCQHSCVAIGRGVHGSSRRLRDNKLPPYLPLLSQGVTMLLFGSTHHPETNAPKLACYGCHRSTQRSQGRRREGNTSVKCEGDFFSGVW